MKELNVRRALNICAVLAPKSPPVIIRHHSRLHFNCNQIDGMEDWAKHAHTIKFTEKEKSLAQYHVEI